MSTLLLICAVYPISIDASKERIERLFLALSKYRSCLLMHLNRELKELRVGGFPVGLGLLMHLKRELKATVMRSVMRKLGE